MPYLKPRRWRRYQLLEAGGFLPFECRTLSRLPRTTPALKLMRADRKRLYDRFERKAVRLGWSATKIWQEYRAQIKRKYKRSGWNAAVGPKGRQKGPRKGNPVPLKMYRYYQRQAPDEPPYESPWKSRRRRRDYISADMVASLRSGLIQKRKAQRRRQ